jgi:hypothetical protein
VPVMYLASYSAFRLAASESMFLLLFCICG